MVQEDRGAFRLSNIYVIMLRKMSLLPNLNKTNNNLVDKCKLTWILVDTKMLKRIILLLIDG